MHIRPARPADMKGVLRLLDEQNQFHVDLLPGFFRNQRTEPSRVEELLGDPDSALLVAEVDSTVVALAEARLARTKDLPVLVQKAYVYVQEMIVTDSFRGKGIGTALMDAVRTWARERGAQSLRTAVVPANKRARDFYEREGFGEIMISLESEL